MIANRKFGIGALLAAMMLMSMVFTPAASAESSNELPEELAKFVTKVDPYTFVFDKEVDDKEAFVAAWNDYENAVKEENKEVTPEYVSREDSGTDTSTKNVFDSYIKGETYFHGIRTDYITSQEFIGDGHTKAWWWGSDPYYADRITLNSKVKTTGVTVSISIPPGMGFSVSGDTATYSGQWNNVWSVTHYYQDLTATGLSIYDEDQNDSETFRFGSTDHTLYTHVDLDA